MNGIYGDNHLAFSNAPRYEAHRDECLACFDALCAHWKEAKGRGHPAAVAALNSVAEVIIW
jgi:hypothetical protein